MKRFLKSIPLLGPALIKIKRALNPTPSFQGSENYWIDRYQKGGNSGHGSYFVYADFKAEVINAFVEEHEIQSVIEFGCGDGNQLKLAKYPSYIGFDVSPDAVSLCKRLFAEDETKQFRLVNQYDGEVADLTLSLDVIYHLIEDEVYHAYMSRLFIASSKFLIIYSSNIDETSTDGAAHVKHRKFTDWIEQHKPDWSLLKHIPNQYQLESHDKPGTFADFYIFQKG